MIKAIQSRSCVKDKFYGCEKLLVTGKCFSAEEKLVFEWRAEINQNVYKKQKNM
jgi:hypothetical protein